MISERKSESESFSFKMCTHVVTEYLVTELHSLVAPCGQRVAGIKSVVCEPPQEGVEPLLYDSARSSGRRVEELWVVRLLGRGAMVSAP